MYSSSPIPYFDFPSDGPPIHFLHANGYPPDCYQPLFELLRTEYHLFGMYLRPLWPDAKRDFDSWNPMADDLLRFLSERGPGPVIGVGHSIGGIVTLRAALRDPEKFRALVLLDPVLFPPYFIRMWNLVRMLGMGHRVHPKISGALKRRREFSNLDMVFRGYRTREVFRYFSDESLWAYIRGMTKPRADGSYELVHSPEWEAHIYFTSVWRDLEIWRGLQNLQVPTLIIRGAESDTFRERAANLVKRKQPKIQIETLPQSTHLLPLERPQEVFDIMQSFLKKNMESASLLAHSPGT